MTRERTRAAHLGEIKDPFSGKMVVVVYRNGELAFRLKHCGQTPKYLRLLDAYSVAKTKTLVEELS